jgi:hypothetical protein
MGISKKLVTSGDEKFVVTENSAGENVVRRNDGWTHGTGTKIGETDTFKAALDVVKSVSGAEDVKIKSR